MAALAIATPVGIPALKSSSVRSVRRTTRAARPAKLAVRRSVAMSADKRSVAERVPAPVLAGLSTAMVFADQVSLLHCASVHYMYPHLNED
mmetsp:Transcript_12023/g.43922  ORF Transcript_12023/g.43922 Transcript_12023/m.43922 type:complete len:91 (+) Transcript_12023:61-333(+)